MSVHFSSIAMTCATPHLPRLVCLHYPVNCRCLTHDDHFLPHDRDQDVATLPTQLATLETSIDLLTQTLHASSARMTDLLNTSVADLNNSIKNSVAQINTEIAGIKASQEAFSTEIADIKTSQEDVRATCKAIRAALREHSATVARVGTFLPLLSLSPT